MNRKKGKRTEILQKSYLVASYWVRNLNLQQICPEEMVDLIAEFYCMECARMCTEFAGRNALIHDDGMTIERVNPEKTGYESSCICISQNELQLCLFAKTKIKGFSFKVLAEQNADRSHYGYEAGFTNLNPYTIDKSKITSCCNSKLYQQNKRFSFFVFFNHFFDFCRRFAILRKEYKTSMFSK